MENRDKMAKRARPSRKKKVVREEEPREELEEAREAAAEEPREELEEAREAAAEIPQKETAREERLSFKQAIFQQCMKDPSFRARVIYHLAKKLR